MYLTLKRKAELTTAGIDITDDIAIRGYYKQQRELTLAAERAAIDLKQSRLQLLNNLLKSHAPLPEEHKLLALIKDAFPKKGVHQWMYQKPVHMPEDLYDPGFLWKEAEAVGWRPHYFDLQRLLACGLLLFVGGHYKTREEFERITIPNHPVDCFESRDHAIKKLFELIPDETIRLNKGTIVFQLHTLLKDLLYAQQKLEPEPAIIEEVSYSNDDAWGDPNDDFSS